MVFVATGHSLGPAQLLSRVAHHLDEEHNTTVRPASWGSWLVASAGTTPRWRQRGQWLVAGWPSADPWGGPRRLDFDTVIDDLERFGTPAMTMVSGPAIGLNIESGRWAGPLNGLMAPGPDPSDHRIMSTAAPRRHLPSASDPISDHSPGFSLTKLEREIARRRPAPGVAVRLVEPTSTTTVVGGRDWANDVFEIGPARDTLVSAPSNLAEVFADPLLTEHARAVVAPELTWRAARRGWALYSPHFERPALDQIGFGWSNTTNRAAP